MNAFTLDDVFSEVPSLIEPDLANQAGQVGTEFDISFEFPSGTTSGGRFVSRSGGGGADFTFGSLSDNTFPVSVDFDPGVTSVTSTFQVGVSSSLNSFVTDFTFDPSGPGSVSGVDAVFRSLTQPFELTVSVPEPGSALILFPLLASAILQRRRI